MSWHYAYESKGLSRGSYSDRRQKVEFCLPTFPSSSDLLHKTPGISQPLSLKQLFYSRFMLNAPTGAQGNECGSLPAAHVHGVCISVAGRQ